MSYVTFISHSSADTWVAKQVAKECRLRGAQTFLDEEKIAVGAKFEVEILAALRQANELVVLMTPWAMKRRYVWMEVGAAWARDIPIVVVLHGLSAAKLLAEPDLPVAIRERNIVLLNDVERYFSELGQRAAQGESA